MIDKHTLQQNESEWYQDGFWAEIKDRKNENFET